MKGAIKRIMGMSILLVGLMTYAVNGDPKPAMEVTSVNKDSFALTINKVDNDMSLIIKDQYGFVFYLGQIESGSNYKKTYNISSLPKGTYIIQVLDDNFSEVYRMSKTDNSMVIKIDFSSPIMNESMLALSMNWKYV